MKTELHRSIVHLHYLFIAALAVCLTSTASATVFLADPVPTGTGAYTDNGNVYAKNPTVPTVVGFSSAWAGYNTSNIKLPSSSTPLSYPSSTGLTPIGSSFVTTGGILTDGRLVQRAIPAANLPSSGTIYVSMLMKATSSSLYSAYPTAATCYGLGRNLRNANAAEASNSYAVRTFPVDGVYFGFTASGLVLCVEGTWYPLVPTITANATYFCVAKIELNADGTKERVSAIVNPAMSSQEPSTWGTNCVVNILDNGAKFSYLNLGGATPNNIYFDELIVAESWVHAVYRTAAIKFSDADTSATTDYANGEIDFAAKLTSTTSSNELFVCFGPVDGGPNTNEWSVVVPWQSPAAAGVAYTTSVAWSLLATNTVYAGSAVATDGVDGDEAFFGNFMNGEVSVALKNNADEEGLVPGSWTISRPTSATNLNLTVNYTITSSDAVAGVNYVNNLGSSVMIPKGATSVDIVLTPLLVAANSDVTVTLTLAAGNYLLGPSTTANLLIDNYDPPADRFVWVAPTAGNASVAANWSTGTVPGAGDDIYLEHFSVAAMAWDAGVNGLPATVKSWTQTASYTGTVTFNTTYSQVDTVFTNFTVTGNAQILGGTWTHQANTDVQRNRLCVAVGGDFTLASGTAIALMGKGFQYGKFHAGSAIATHATSPQGNHSQIYGDVYKPTELGSGGDSSNSAKSYGGGAVYLVVTGTAVVDGTIDVRSGTQKTSGNNPEKGCGAGGSVYLSATSISGAGSVNASCYDVTETCYSYNGSGGRVALIARSGTVSLPLANIKANGGAAGNSAGAGTIYLKNATDANGTLLVGNSQGNNWSYIVRPPKKTSCTAVKPGETWTFDRVLLRDQGILSVPATATLSLGGGYQSVTNLTVTTDPMAGLLYLGGTINIPAAAEHQISGKWVFQADSPYTFDADVRISNYAAFGNLLLYQAYPTNAPACDITVDGDLAIASTGYLYGPGRGVRSGVSTTISYHGGIASGAATTLAYDSILNPVYPGNNGQSGDSGNTNPGGGTVKVTVTGTFTHDGSATVEPVAKNTGWNRGSAGSLNITAAYLNGSGSMNANGMAGSGTLYSGAGGRVSVRLTGAGATFDAFGAADINAKGGTHSAGTASLMASAGTVYLQSGAQAEGAGTLIVRNTGGAAITAVTPIPSTRWGGENDVFDAASLSLEEYARVKLTKSFKMDSATVASGTTLDLNGYTLRVKRLTVAGVKFGSGTYAATDFASCVTDTAGTAGRIVVEFTGTLLTIK